MWDAMPKFVNDSAKPLEGHTYNVKYCPFVASRTVPNENTDAAAQSVTFGFR